MPSTIGMKDGGFYDQHSGAQLASIQILFSWIAETVRTMPLPDRPGQPITVLDLGSSEGRNALAVMHLVAEGLRRRTTQPIATVYSDLYSNNFNQLFRNLHAGGLLPEVYPSTVPGSFYGPLLPPESVHLATCFNAILWLDHLPAPVPNFTVYQRPVGQGPHLAPETVAAFSGQAEQDWIRFLQGRARELASGGKLVVGTPGDSATHRCSDGLYHVLNDACLDLVAAGRVPRASYERLTVPVYFRTLDELRAPLERPDSGVFGAFTVERAETLQAPTPFVEAFRQTGDRETYADAFTGFLRAFSEPIARAALAGSGEDGTVIDALYDRVRERLLKEPERYAFQYIMVAIVLTRR
jgi:SAM dependent carboxyl methyltransferase